MTSIKRGIVGLSSFLFITFAWSNSISATQSNYLSSKESQDHSPIDRLYVQRLAKHIRSDEDRGASVKEMTNDYRPVLARAYGAKRDFLSRAIPLAIQIQARYGIPASSILAMACFESNYGQSTLSEDAHNYFGIKALVNWTGDVTWTYTKDRGYRHKQPFREYDSMAESFNDYAKFLSGQPRYRVAFDTSNGREFVRRVLRCGYCPDSDYLDYISEIMERYNLRSLDRS